MTTNNDLALHPIQLVKMLVEVNNFERVNIRYYKVGIEPAQTPKHPTLPTLVRDEFRVFNNPSVFKAGSLDDEYPF